MERGAWKIHQPVVECNGSRGLHHQSNHGGALGGRLSPVGTVPGRAGQRSLPRGWMLLLLLSRFVTVCMGEEEEEEGEEHGAGRQGSRPGSNACSVFARSNQHRPSRSAAVCAPRQSGSGARKSPAGAPHKGPAVFWS